MWGVLSRVADGDGTRTEQSVNASSGTSEGLGLGGLELGLVDHSAVPELGETTDLVRRARGTVPDDSLDVLPLGCVAGLGVLDGVLRHLLAASDQVDEHPEVGKH